MIDFSKFIDYPMWFKCAIFTWIALTLFIATASLLVSPKNKEQLLNFGAPHNNETNRNSKMPEKSQPVINATDSVISVNQKGGQTAKTINNNVSFNSSGRIIPPGILAKISEVLSAHSGKSVSIQIANNDMQGKETTEFAEGLHKLFMASGWKSALSNSHNMIANGVVETGLTINTIGQENAEIGNFIYQKLMSIGLRASLKSYATSDESKDIFLQVWTK